MVRLTREEFTALARQRGYTLTAVGQLWGLSRSRMSQIAADLHRAPHWDYALWGLPAKSATARVEARRARMLPRLRAAVREPPEVFFAIEIGDVWLVRDSPGEHLPEGAAGIVENLFTGAGAHQAVLHFPMTGYRETVPVSYLQQPHCFLSPTGRNVRIDSAS